jgi:hypothetical protein
MNFENLRKPFPPEDIEWRIQRAGEKNNRLWAMCLAYVDSRAIRKRLNDVCGPENWQSDFKSVGNGICCRIGIRFMDQWIWKSDGAGETQVESVKGNFSDALKRAGYSWGIGEYLYDLDAGFANIHDNGSLNGQAKINGSVKYFKYDPPSLPAWALPEGMSQAVTKKPAAKKPAAKKQPQATSWTKEQNAKLFEASKSLGLSTQDRNLLKGYICQQLEIDTWDEIPAKGKAGLVVNKFADYFDEWTLKNA